MRVVRCGALALLFLVGAVVGLALVGAPECSASGQVQTCIIFGNPVAMEPFAFMAFTHGVTLACGIVAVLIGRSLWPSRAA